MSWKSEMAGTNWTGLRKSRPQFSRMFLIVFIAQRPSIKCLADDFRVRICVRLFIQYWLKQDKIGKSVELKNYVLLVSYGKLRKQGSLEVMPVNHFVRGSSPCWAKIQNGRFSSVKRPFVFGIECFFLRAYQMVFRSKNLIYWNNPGRINVSEGDSPWISA